MHGIEILKTGKEFHFAHFFEFENHKKDAKLKQSDILHCCWLMYQIIYIVKNSFAVTCIFWYNK